MLKPDEDALIPHYLRDESEPYSLPIVVHVERNVELNETDAFAAVASAIGLMLSSDKWNESIQEWMKGRIRKVARKARGAAWDNLQELDHISASHGDVEVMIFEPHKLEETPAAIKKLQVQGIQFNQVAPTLSFDDIQKGLVVSVNPELIMSSGKLMAQVGHAVQLAVLEASESELLEWAEDGFVVAIVKWASMPTNSIHVTDAGFTEIPAGSLTVKSIFI